MDSNLINLIISLISGAIGGNIAGASMPKKDPGAVTNTVAGLIGGGLGDFILKALGVLAAANTTANGGAPAGNELDLASILATIGAGGASGGILTAIIALIKDAIQKKQ